MERYEGMKRIQVWVNEELYEQFKEDLYPVTVQDAISAYVRIVVSSRTKPFQKVIDEGLEEVFRRVLEEK